MLERFKAWYEEARIAPEVFQAVSAKNLSRPLDINNRVYAVAEFCKLPEAAALASANKRVSNLLGKAEGQVAASIQAHHFDTPCEFTLNAAIQQADGSVPAYPGASWICSTGT